jgi:hypothetical protein
VKKIKVGGTYWVDVPEGLPSRFYGSPGSRRGAELRNLCGRRFELTVMRIEASARPYPAVEGVSTVEIPLVEDWVRVSELVVSGRVDGAASRGEWGEPADQDGQQLTVRRRVRIRVPARWLRRESRSAG